MTPLSQAEPWLRYIFTWHCLSDACPKCLRLDGREWRDQDIFQDTLTDPWEGDLWDLTSDLSLAHPNCRCQLAVTVLVDWSKREEFQILAQRFGVHEEIEELNLAGITELRDKVEQLEQTANSSIPTLRESEYLLYRISGLFGRMGLPPVVDAAISKIQRMVLIVRTLHGAMLLLERGTTFGIISGIITLLGGVMTTATLMDMERPVY